MSNIVTITGSLNLQTTDGVNVTLNGSGIQILMAGKNFAEGTMVTGTSEAAIPLGSIGTIGLAVFKNLDPTNSIWIGATGQENIGVGPGEVAVLRFKSTTVPYAKSSAATPLLQYIICEN